MLGGERGGDRLLDVAGRCLVDLGGDVLVAVGRVGGHELARAHFLAADHYRDVERVAGELLERLFHLGAL